MILDKKVLVNILQSEETSPLENDVEIEDIITIIKDVDNKVEFLNKLKKSRTESINHEIEKLSNKKDKLKEIISMTLEKFGHKSLNFPGVGRVSVKNSSGKWQIKDEELLMSALTKELSKEVLSTIVIEKPSLIKKELDKILDEWKITGKDTSFAEKGEDEKNIMISFDKENKINTDDVQDIEDNREPGTIDEKYDKIEF